MSPKGVSLHPDITIRLFPNGTVSTYGPDNVLLETEKLNAAEFKRLTHCDIATDEDSERATQACLDRNPLPFLYPRRSPAKRSSGNPIVWMNTPQTMQCDDYRCNNDDECQSITNPLCGSCNPNPNPPNAAIFPERGRCQRYPLGG